MAGSYINHLVDLQFALTFALFMPGSGLTFLFQKPAPESWIYLGDLSGAIFIYILDLTVRNIHTLCLSLFFPV